MAFKRMSQWLQKPQENVDPFHPGALIDGRYELLAEIGRGGMGIVFRARDLQSGRMTALKVLDRKTANALSLTQFAREARISTGLSHPNLVNTLASGEVDGTPYLVMELVEGGSLADLQHLPVATVLELAVQVCTALEYLHTQGVIHHDLKPGNILLQKSGLRLQAKLMDFGLARSANEAGLEQESGRAGSYFYLAPELILGAQPAPASDLYALGVMLYELLTGRVPFSDYDEAAVLNQHLHETPQLPGKARAGIPRELDAVVLRLLEKEPARRYPSAADLRHALEAINLPKPPPTGSLPALTKDVDPAQAQALVERILAEPIVQANSPSLALAAAHQLAPQFRDGVWWVDLSSVSEPALVPQTVAQALLVEIDPKRPLMASLFGALRERSLLLVLADGCARAARDQFVQALVSQCPEVRVVVCADGQ